VASTWQDREHERAVAAFLSSVPKRRRERAEAKYQVIEGRQLRHMQEHEGSWQPDLIDALLVDWPRPDRPSPVHRFPSKIRTRERADY
jgi:hypothetical protein